MRSSTIRNVAIGILALMLAYHLGASRAGAQAPSNPLVCSMSNLSCPTVFTANGDVYQTCDPNAASNWHKVTNVFGGAPVPAQRATFGQVQQKFVR